MDRERAIELHPLTPERWPDLVSLFGRRGACGGCWCMYWRLPPQEYNQPSRGERNKRLLHALVESGKTPGILAYVEGNPVGWCAIGPREEFIRLKRSPYYAKALAPVDDEPVWSVVCFYIKPEHRGRGLSLPLLGAAVEFAKCQGASIIEAYPLDQGPARGQPSYTGAVSTFRQLGFQEIARRYANRPLLRLSLPPEARAP